MSNSDDIYRDHSAIDSIDDSVRATPSRVQTCKVALKGFSNFVWICSQRAFAEGDDGKCNLDWQFIQVATCT